MITVGGLIRALLVVHTLAFGFFLAWWPRDRLGRLILDMREAERAIVLRLVKRPPPPWFGQALLSGVMLGIGLLAWVLS